MATLELRYANRVRSRRFTMDAIGAWFDLCVTRYKDAPEDELGIYWDKSPAAAAWRNGHPRELPMPYEGCARLTFCDEPISDAYDPADLSPSMTLGDALGVIAAAEGLESVTVDGGEVWSLGAACAETAALADVNDSLTNPTSDQDVDQA